MPSWVDPAHLCCLDHASLYDNAPFYAAEVTDSAIKVDILKYAKFGMSNTLRLQTNMGGCRLAVIVACLQSERKTNSTFPNPKKAGASTLDTGSQLSGPQN